MLALLTLLAACGADEPESETTFTPEAPAEAPLAPAEAPLAPAQMARSAGGVVASGQPLATAAGRAMLEQGGNAVDAAVATAFALAVVEPSMSGLGGRTQILIRTSDGEIHGIDATTQAPSSYNPATAPQASYGYATVGVPGTVAGLTRAVERFGSLDLSEIMAPAIALARDGFELLPGEASRHAAAREQLAESEGARAYFLKEDGSPHRAGELFVQEELARTLEAIAEGGAEVFYRGWIAERIAEDMAANHGHVTLQALAEYRAEDSRIVRGSYRGYDLAGLWIPSFGAITVEALHILETLPMGELSRAEWGVAVGEGIRAAYGDRASQETWADAERLTSKEWARRKAAELLLPATVGRGVAGEATAGTAGTAGMTAVAGTAVDRWADSGDGVPEPDSWRADPGHTTHLTAADGQGNVVALTQSLGPNLGSKVAAPGLGFMYAATLGGYLGEMQPGARAASHISPFMVLLEGEPFLALGAAGGGRIPPAIVAVVSRVIDHGMSLEEALQAPRVYPMAQGIQVEIGTGLGFTPEELEAMRALGFEVEVVDREGVFGRVHAVRFDAITGTWVAAADPDWEGAALGARAGR